MGKGAVWGFIGRHTSIVKSSSIFTAFPKMKMNCMRFENSQQFRMRCERLGSAAGSEDSVSALLRFREDMVEEVGMEAVEATRCSGGP